jgi:ABC-type sugar transport system ATPase subunit
VASVELIDVHKRYGDNHIVKGVSLSIGTGEFLVLVGPSGCGKSTCLRMIAGLEEISSGEVRIDGDRMNELVPRDRDIGMVFQSYALYPHMTVGENLAFGLTLRKMPKAQIQARVAEAAKMLELEALLSRRPKELSGGQRQRVAIGRSIVRRPRVFLFDEPLSNLDASLRVQMRAEILSLHRRLGTTMIYVTHDQVEAMTLATRIAVLNGGHLQQCDTPAALFGRPVNKFVAGFIGSPSMNFVEGTIENGSFKAPGWWVPLIATPKVSTGAKVTLGVRPHDFTPGEGGIVGEVVVVESMGWEAYVHVETLAGRIVVRLEGEIAQRVKAGDKLPLLVKPEHVHLFDSAGLALAAPTAASPVTARATA